MSQRSIVKVPQTKQEEKQFGYQVYAELAEGKTVAVIGPVGPEHEEKEWFTIRLENADFPAMRAAIKSRQQARLWRRSGKRKHGRTNIISWRKRLRVRSNVLQPSSRYRRLQAVPAGPTAR